MKDSRMASLLLLILFSIFHSQLQVLSTSHTNPNQDDGYMKFVHEADALPKNEEYDYIIVGGGTAGCSLAATLASKYSVLILERGSDPKSFPFLFEDEGLSHTLSDKDDGVNPFNHFMSEEGVDNIRARVLGGTSMINNGFYSRAQPEFFSISGVDWDMDLVEKSYQWVEKNLVFEPILNPWQSAFRKTLLESGVNPDNGFTFEHLIGTKTGGTTFDSNGIRHGAVELLKLADPNNLKVVVQASVRRILFSGLSATGVLYTDSKGILHRVSIRKTGEIIVSAGAIGSPQILLLSGVGPKSDLSSLKIPVVLDQPHVGEFMTDHPRFGVYIMLPFETATSDAQVVGILENNLILNSVPSTLTLSIPQTFSLLPPNSTSVNMSLVTLQGKPLKIASIGSLKLASTDVKKNPIVKFNYFSKPEDVAQCVRGVRKVADLLKTETINEIMTKDLKGNKGFQFLGPPLPENLSDDAVVEKYCKDILLTFWHYHGGCLVGKVVDGDYKVVGLENVRVVDGSTFNQSPGTNPMATVLMIGRYVGTKILQQREANKMAIRKIIATF